MSPNEKFSKMRLAVESAAATLPKITFAEMEFRYQGGEVDVHSISDCRLIEKKISEMEGIEDTFDRGVVLMRVTTAAQLLDEKGDQFCTTIEDFQEMIALFKKHPKGFKEVYEKTGVKDFYETSSKKEDSGPQLSEGEIEAKN